ncbi:MAG: F0F1 ATP synthase subunit A, partial [Candidatus Magasanikbacteria bacterium]|nr:F0F1 ATP synthase subunit A [Candidatus Magasanikbacteria bacterium]
RLFGNIFAGEVLMTVMASLVSFLVPTPFMFLELLVGLIQAGVFAMLTLVYLTVATSQPHGAEQH